MALSDRAELILAKNLGHRRAAELRAALDLAYNSGGNDVLNARGRKLIENIFGLTNGEDFCAISDAAGYPSGARVEDLLVDEFGAGDGIELLRAFRVAYSINESTGYTFSFVTTLSGGSENQIEDDGNTPHNMLMQTDDQPRQDFIASFAGSETDKDAGDVIVITDGTDHFRAHIHSVYPALTINTWGYAPALSSLFTIDSATLTLTRIPVGDFITATYDSSQTSGDPGSGEVYASGSSLFISGGASFVDSIAPGDVVVLFTNGSADDSSLSVSITVQSVAFNSGHATICGTSAIDMSIFSNGDVITIYRQPN